MGMGSLKVMFFLNEVKTSWCADNIFSKIRRGIFDFGEDPMGKGILLYVPYLRDVDPTFWTWPIFKCLLLIFPQEQC